MLPLSSRDRNDPGKEARGAFLADKSACDRVVLVAASIGPRGAILDGPEYTGSYAIGEDDLLDFRADRLLPHGTALRRAMARMIQEKNA